MADPRMLAEMIAHAPRPFDDGAAARLRERLGEAYARAPERAQKLIDAIGGCSPYLSRLAAADPQGLSRLLAAPPDVSLRALIAEAQAASAGETADAAKAALRRAKRKAALLFALADLGGVWDVGTAMRAWSDFADACVAAAFAKGLALAGAQGARGLAVIAMGKLGAHELNYSSDVDLVVFYDPALLAENDRALAKKRAVDATKHAVALLQDRTADGYCFRADLRLRPDPGSSAVAVSVAAAETYYETYGQNWERAAYIKARPIAGDLDAGEAFLERLRPYVWRKSMDFAAIEDVHSIKRQIHAVKGGGEIATDGHDLKLGRGGIREIEFFVQTQQLILGGKKPELRLRETLAALDALAHAGHVTRADADRLSDAYVFLRRLEHRVQMINDEQSHKTPSDDAGFVRLAAFSGYDGPDALRTALKAELRAVHARYADLFEEAPPLSAAAGSLIFTGVEDNPETIETLRKFGFTRPEDISRTVRGWHAGGLPATRAARSRAILTRLVPVMLEAFGGAEDPDAAFFAFDAYLKSLPAGVQVFSLFYNNPSVFDAFARLLSVAPPLARALARRPNFLETMIDEAFLSPPQDLPELEADLAAALAREDGFEGALNAARRWCGEERFRLSAQLVLGAIEPQAAARAFADVAEAAVRALLPVSVAEMRRQHGRAPGGLAVLAMGRLGARKMTAASDLDLIFVYDAPEVGESDGARPLDPITYYTRLVRRYVAALSAPTEEGALYEVDMQLRPSGGAGPAAVKFSAFETYYDTDAWTWEMMALTRARVVAGDPGLALRIEAKIAEMLDRPRERAALAREVDAMRERIAAAKPSRGVWNVKRERGGLTDLDFIAQFCALAMGRERPRDPPESRVALEAAAAAGLLDRRAPETLDTARNFQEGVLQLLRAARAKPSSCNDMGAALSARIAESCGADHVQAAERRLKRLQNSSYQLYRNSISTKAK